jgi:hypothetical protein
MALKTNPAAEEILASSKTSRSIFFEAEGKEHIILDTEMTHRLEQYMGHILIRLLSHAEFREFDDAYVAMIEIYNEAARKTHEALETMTEPHDYENYPQFPELAKAGEEAQQNLQFLLARILGRPENGCDN